MGIHAALNHVTHYRYDRAVTLGPQVVDSFYVRGPDGGKVTDAAFLAEAERALLHALATPF